MKNDTDIFLHPQLSEQQIVVKAIAILNFKHTNL